MMKKSILTLVFAFVALMMNAQNTPHAIGLHIGGSTIDVEYQYHFNNKNFVDVTAGVFDLDEGFLAQGVYDWNIKQWGNWTPNFGTWNLWGGVGAGLGFFNGDEEDGFMLGPVGHLGFGFTLKRCPFSLGVDYRPMVAFVVGNNSGLVNSGFWNLGLSMTYRF